MRTHILSPVNASSRGRPLPVDLIGALLEGPSKTAQKLGEDDGPVLQLTGRTRCDRIVVFDGTRRQIGQLAQVTIYDATPFTLFGSVVTQHIGPEVYTLSG